MHTTVTCLKCAKGNKFPTERADAHPKCAACGTPLLPRTPSDISLEVLKKAERIDELPLVVDFWAAWCGPCRMMAPEFAKAAQALEARVRFAKLDTEAYPETGMRYGIRGIPLLIAFRDGREIGRQTGLMASADIVTWLNSVSGS